MNRTILENVIEPIVYPFFYDFGAIFGCVWCIYAFYRLYRASNLKSLENKQCAAVTAMICVGITSIFLQFSLRGEIPEFSSNEQLGLPKSTMGWQNAGKFYYHVSQMQEGKSSEQIESFSQAQSRTLDNVGGWNSAAKFYLTLVQADNERSSINQ